MNLNRIQFNTVFSLTKDIRRYTYDLEQFIKVKVSNFQVIPAPSIPDEIEPEIPRYIAQANISNKIIKFEISQLRITFLIESTDGKKLIEQDFDEFLELISSIKEELKKLIPNFFILYEGIIIIEENIVNEFTQIKLLNSFKENSDELREKESILKDNKYFITIEKVVVKVFNQENVIPSLSKNKNDMFAGYLEVYVKEINNRYLYNTTDIGTDNLLNIKEIKEPLKER